MILPKKTDLSYPLLTVFFTTYVYRKTLRVHGQKEPREGGPRKDSAHSPDSYKKKEKGPRKKCPRGQTGSPRSSSHKAPPATGQGPVRRLSRISPRTSCSRPAASLKARLGSGPDLVPTGTAAPPSAAAASAVASAAASGGGQRRREAAGVQARGEASRRERQVRQGARPSRPPRGCPRSVWAPSGERSSRGGFSSRPRCRRRPHRL